MDEFKAAWWLPGPHFPTLWAALARPRSSLRTQLERLELADGDFIDLRWTGSSAGPIVLVLHGLEGSPRSRYVGAILERIERRGWGGLLMLFRGCGGKPNRLNRSYHSGDTGDLEFLLSTLVKRYPTRPIMAIGYSLGGNVLLKYLGQSATNSKLTAAAAISVPFDLGAAADRLNRGLSKLYQHYLIRSLKNKIRMKFSTRSAPLPLDKIARWNDFRSFDDNVTAPLHGFTDVDEYYTHSSCRQYLRSITTPTLIIHSKDDPFLTTDAIPKSNELSFSTEMILTERGGHVGFVCGRNPLKPRYWIDDCLIAWLGNLYDHL
ncbi:MAG TPA: hydrolase [Gammaproteobacteria bacterium]|nr:hydrolase [Gammaproteobacteria bacterium]